MGMWREGKVPYQTNGQMAMLLIRRLGAHFKMQPTLYQNPLNMEWFTFSSDDLTVLLT